ncbi:Prolyl oligopeptidase family protein [Perilla frutescens var. frutescens]|nr:Prolyl oligopeptidase family protein [Perilla frutescens var. frutescens]
MCTRKSAELDGMDEEFSDPDNPKHTRSASVTEDGKYVLLYTFENCDPVNKMYYCDISMLHEGLQGYKGRKELLPFDAPRYKLVRVDVNDPTCWTEVVREDERDVLKSAVAVNRNQIIMNYLRDVKNVLQLKDLETGSFLQQLPLDIGTVYDSSARRKDRMVFIGFTSFLIPGIIYECNLEAEAPEMKILREIVVPGFDKTAFEVKQVFYPSKDGTKIPMFMVGRKGISLDSSHPCLLYGYGGFNISITLSFTVSRIVIAKHLDVVFCIANIRGGEYGEEWHRSGALLRKQKCFDDFISAAEYLVSAGYTQLRKLCIEGGSNGGLLIRLQLQMKIAEFKLICTRPDVVEVFLCAILVLCAPWIEIGLCLVKQLKQSLRKEKLGDRIKALHQLVSPFGKTDTASFLLEAIGYIRFLHGQIEVYLD